MNNNKKKQQKEEKEEGLQLTCGMIQSVSDSDDGKQTLKIKIKRVLRETLSIKVIRKEVKSSEEK